MVRRIKPVCVVFLLFLLNSGYVSSDEWSVKGHVDQDISYDDNVFMDVGSNRQSSFKYRIIPLITFQHKTDVSDVSASASYGTQLYTDIEGFDQDIQNYSLSGLYQTERIDWGLDATYSVIPTRNNAVLNSGVFNNNSNQNTWGVSPYLTYKINAETDSITFMPSYTETTFSRPPGNANNNFFNDSQSYNFNLAWQHLWSPQYLSEVSFFYNRFDSQLFIGTPQGNVPADSGFDNYGLNISNTYQISDNWKLDATVGGRFTESLIGDDASSSFGFLADVAINYAVESYTAGLHFNRGLIPSSFGQLQEQTSLGLDFNYFILENLTAKLTANYQETTVVNTTTVNAVNTNLGDRTNFVIEPSVNWRLARDWTLGGSYRYRFQDNQGGNAGGFIGEADSNLFLLSLNYNWQGISKSR